MTEPEMRTDAAARIRPVSPFEGKAGYIARVLREQIDAGELLPGDELRQRHIADRFGVSATPVREALSRLAAEGYVETQLHRGARILRSARDRRAENWLIRARLETLAVELAAPRLDDGDVADIFAAAAAFERAETPEEVHRTNIAFHFAIYEASEAPVLVRMLKELWGALDVPPTGFRSHDESGRQHRAIAEALRDRRTEDAVRLTETHILATSEQARRYQVEGAARDRQARPEPA